MPASTASRYTASRLSFLAILFTGACWLLYSVLFKTQPADTHFRHPDVHVDCDSFATLPAKRIAIIGAGSAGASTAYYINRFGSLCQPTNITVYEASNYVGGRSTTVNVYGDPGEPVELGASIFVQVNRNLVSAAKEFGLVTTRNVDGRPKESPDMLGVWDGSVFKFVQSEGGSQWWNIAKLLWKYGLAPLRTQRLMQTVVGNFTKMYDAPHFPFRSLSQTSYDLGLTAVTSETGYDYLAAHGIRPPFSTDIVQASTRVNYAQNLGEINGLLALVCMSTDGAMAVQGGNWQIFDGMLRASGAKVLLNTRVSVIADQDDGTYLVHSEHSDALLSQPETQPAPATFDEVVLAAPFQFAHLKLPPSVPHTPDTIPYVRLHVTLLASPHRLSPAAFHLPPSTPAPEIILTTLPTAGYLSPPSARAPAGFLSISTLRTLHNPSSPTGGRPEYLYKIFSPHALNATFVAGLLGFATEAEALAGIAVEDVSWLYEKVWDSYPYLPPRVTFEEPVLGRGVWYTSGVEGFISTMETSSLMGMDVARLMVDGWGEGEAGVVEAEDHGDL
ncbi:hypothetical protein MMC17_008313 [Xylographa soralifera]|nr:hypothetical protein [Xylographa soralifera]